MVSLLNLKVAHLVCRRHRANINPKNLTDAARLYTKYHKQLLRHCEYRYMDVYWDSWIMQW